MVTEVLVDFLNPVYFMTEAAANERSHGVTAGELETLSKREMTFPCYCLLVSRSDRIVML